MPLVGDMVTIDRSKLPIADMDDFRVLTNKSLEQYIDEFRKGGERQIKYLDDMLDPEVRALIWVRMRDDETRYRVWADDDELWAAFEADIRRLTTDDIHNMAEAVRQDDESEAPVAKRRAPAKRSSGAKRRASTA